MLEIIKVIKCIGGKFPENICNLKKNFCYLKKYEHFTGDNFEFKFRKFYYFEEKRVYIKISFKLA